MITLEISKQQIERANSLYSFGELNNSITKGKSNIYGAIGEIVLYDYAANYASVSFASTYDYDLLINTLRVDVKTKRTTVKPAENYLCSIAAYNTKQDCDIYYFVRVDETMNTAYLLGHKWKSDFFNEAIFAKQGELDVNGWAFKSDCYNLPISQLIQPKLLSLYYDR